jgi:surface antigen
MRQRTRTALGSIAAAMMLSLAPSGVAADIYWQCVPFARLISGIQIFGDARTWWDQATGRYDKGVLPKAGAVLCFKPVGKMRLGHVAVVSQVLTDRVIQITHANWSRIDGSRGQVEKDVTVIDVSPQGDWSEVKVWYDPAGDLGSTTYPTWGFIYQDREAMQVAAASSKVAYAQNAAISVAQSAASQVASTVRPGASPLQRLGQAAGSTDRIASLIHQATAPGAD